MRPRVLLAKALIRFGGPLGSQAIRLMKPNDLVEFSRLTYSHPRTIEQWTSDRVVEEGLSAGERTALSIIPLKKGRILVLGLGGGREAVALARIGFDVTGVDFVAEMLEKGIENVRSRGFRASGLVSDISDLELNPQSFDIAWLSSGMYSCIPGTARRVNVLKKIARALRPGGCFVLQFHWGSHHHSSTLYDLIGRFVALVTFGNLSYENGDVLWGNAEFLHFFHSEGDLRSEFERGGFQVTSLRVNLERLRGDALLQRP